MTTPDKLDRQTFLKTCGAICLAAAGLPVLVSSCKSVYYAQTPALKGKTIELSRNEFEQVNKKGVTTMRNYVLVELPGQTFPIYLHRTGDAFTAVLMKCSHQGNELNAHEGFLTCPAHGSEYDAQGRVTEGPADRDLTAYRVTADDHKIYILIA